MPRYSVSGAVHGSTWIGWYDANTPQEAIERAYNDAGISLCHECARKVSDPEVLELVAEDVETGDATSEATTNDQIVEQSRKIERLIDIVREVAPDRLEDKIYQDWKTEALSLRAENAAMQQHIQELQERLSDL